MTGRGDGSPVQGHYATGDCPSGKRGFNNRRAAKALAASVRAGNGEHLRPYRCPTCPLWHVGHLPLDVIQGRTSSAAHYDRKTS